MSGQKKELLEFETINNIKIDNSYYKITNEEDKLLDSEPWKKDPTYFKTCKISLVSVIKMLNHARMGGEYEVMGLIQGKVEKNGFIIQDSFALPVEASETRVNAQSEAMEYSVRFQDLDEAAKKNQNIRGWYHSHPSYGCWLSGIDVTTQSLQQQQDPMLAVVIDPIRTMTNGKIEIGAFRCYPKDYQQQGTSFQQNAVIPSDKENDFGLHASKYYPLQVQIYKSQAEQDLITVLWNKYWINTLTSSPIFDNNAYFIKGMSDCAKKTASKNLMHVHEDQILDHLKGKSQQSQKLKDSVKFAMENNQAIMAETLKSLLFNYQV